MLLEEAGKLRALEIKSGATLVGEWQGFAGGEALPPLLVYGGEGLYERQGVRVTGWRDLAGL